MKPGIANLPARLVTLATLATLATLSGCVSSISGLGGSERLSCKAPEGVVCTSVSGVYANAASIPSRAAVSAPAPPALYSSNAVSLSQDNPATPSTTVVRASPRVLRLWIAPWEDGDGDLHEASTVHVLVDHGRWLIDHVRPASRHRIDAVAPPLPTSADTPKPAGETPARNETLPVPGAAPALNALPH